MRLIKEIIIHCSATREGQDISVDTIRKWHVEGRGWSDIGYHLYVDINGEIHGGRDIAKETFTFINRETQRQRYRVRRLKG